ncbi:hypothetical protein [Faecalicoccus pleomorphus]|uniref:hypothetical protein n=1 Tax=Faecalicoccus pleomorphus TaxID=1323 RepID=UPI0026F04F53|nr:hypothetical protein [Faecalicoccus pleomorphus]
MLIHIHQEYAIVVISVLCMIVTMGDSNTSISIKTNTNTTGSIFPSVTWLLKKKRNGLSQMEKGEN